eukprot:scpid109151/ scgid26220/ 
MNSFGDNPQVEAKVQNDSFDEFLLQLEDGSEFKIPEDKPKGDDVKPDPTPDPKPDPTPTPLPDPITGPTTSHGYWKYMGWKGRGISEPKERTIISGLTNGSGDLDTLQKNNRGPQGRFADSK